MSAPAPPNDAPPGAGGDDWRASVAQSFRSSEVRSIAKVLASLEPGATSASKTMLAMRFEESIFQAASDLDDYRKTIQKRLKRLQKHYAKQQAQKAAGGGGDDTPQEDAARTREKELLLEAALREEYGPRLLYIARNADRAVAATRASFGDHKADVLKQHSNNAKQWAVHIGLDLPEQCGGKYVRQEKRDMEFLTKLKTYMETRVDNIRSHISKIIDTDLFLQEALVKLDDFMLKDEASRILRAAFERADPDHPQFNEREMTQLLDRMNAPVPIPRRNQHGDRVRAAAARIEKVRAGAQALYLYLGLRVADKTNFPGCIEKAHTVIIDCLKELEGEYGHLVKDQDEKGEDGKRAVQLEDAWNKAMQFSELEVGGDAASMDEEDDAVSSITWSETMEGPEAKRPKTEEVVSRGTVPVVVRTRYLLAPGRNTFSTLLPALKRKKATLVRNRSMTFVRLEFGKAFEMTIYFLPLLVTIRAMGKETAAGNATRASLIGGHRWPSLYQGLRPADNAPAENNGNSVTKSNDMQVLGVSGSYESLAPIIAKKLEYASSQATYVLRRCFAETTVGKAAMAKSEFEIEILEAGALIRFLQMARSTYMPDWVEDA